MKQKLLVCGATGFVGRNMVEYFARKGEYDIHAVRFNRPSYKCEGVTWHHADLREPETFEKLLDSVDIIVQAAATSSGAKDIAVRPYIHVTDNAVMNSLLFRAAFERKVKHVIFFSCTIMYQSSNVGVKESDFNANTPLHPRYFGAGNTKLYIEKMCEFYASISETKFTAIRHSNIYGAHDKFDLERSHVFGATITKVMTAKESVTVWGIGDEERDLLHADDLANFVDLAIKKQPKKFGLYNCGLGKALSIKDLVNKVVKASGKPLEIKHDLSQPSIKTSLFLDCMLAEKELGWKPQVTLDEGIQRTIEWWSDNIESLTI
jgi:GDP-L-fucose synthase